MNLLIISYNHKNTNYITIHDLLLNVINLNNTKK
jgi:hypothetical protein